MRRGKAFPGRASSTFLLTFLAAVVASAGAVGVLYGVYSPPAPDTADPSAELTALGDGMSAEERRELTRQMLKARRENPETPAEVRPVPTSRPATPPTADAPAPSPADVKVRPGPAAPPARLAARNKPVTAVASLSSPGAAAVNILPGGVPPAGTAIGATLPPVVVPGAAAKAAPGTVAADPNAAPGQGVNGDPAAAPAPAPRGLVANVFSTISGFAGSAANVTGNTVNWVIDLPGKAISAGGKLGSKLLGSDNGAGNSAPQSSPPPPPKGS